MNRHDMMKSERRQETGRWAWMALALVLAGIVGTDVLVARRLAASADKAAALQDALAAPQSLR